VQASNNPSYTAQRTYRKQAYKPNIQNTSATHSCNRGHWRAQARQTTKVGGWASTRPNTLAWLRRHSVIRSTHTARQTISQHEHDKVAVAQHSITMTMNEAKTLVNTPTAFGSKQRIIPSSHTHKKAINRHGTSVQPSNEPHRIQAMQSLAWPATLPLVCW